MTWQSGEGMKEYLKPTKMCDSDNVQLREKAKDIIKGAETPKEAALRIFYYTRDQIRFGLDYPDKKASQTLKKRMGFCITKCNLQIALLRTIDIPARCHYVHLTKESLKALTPRFMYNKLPEAIVHIWCECYLSGNWLACEALLDEEYYKGLLKMGAFTSEQVPTIDWDGETNLILVKHRVVKDIDTFSSRDDAMSEGLKRGDEMPMTN
ncbi:MAG: transglutaminase domain-containing protein, partial [Deltaproteobacteria bacterium]|nr:transglutaminase domain-containing protein [Deltaproteobacteria bacterium]